MWIIPTGKNPKEFAGFVYKITNNLTGRAYIGRKLIFVRRKNNFIESDWLGYFGSSRYLKSDISLFGKHNFSREILLFCSTTEETFIEEEKIQVALDVLHSLLPDGSKAFYNRSIGYKKFTPPSNVDYATREKMRAAAKMREKRKQSVETKKKIGDANRGKDSPFKGASRAADIKDKISATKKAMNTKFTDEHKMKLRAAKLGKKRGPHSPEHSAKISAAALAKSKERSEKMKKIWSERKAKNFNHPNNQNI